MIEMLKGVIADVSKGSVLVATASGLSFRVLCHARLSDAMAGPGSEIALDTALVVKDGEPSLYGFMSSDERTCFAQLQTASGIGPRLAHAILGVYDVNTLADILSREDVKALSRVPGLGARKAERLARELKDRFDVPKSETSATSSPAFERTDIETALVGLGFAASSVREAVRSIAAQNAGIDDAALLKRALQSLGAGK